MKGGGKKGSGRNEGILPREERRREEIVGSTVEKREEVYWRKGGEDEWQCAY
jgi:hypothetical protein